MVASGEEMRVRKTKKKIIIIINPRKKGLYMYRCRYLRLRRYVYNMYYRYILLLYVYIRSTTIALFDQNMYVCVCI